MKEKYRILLRSAGDFLNAFCDSRSKFLGFKKITEWFLHNAYSEISKEDRIQLKECYKSGKQIDFAYKLQDILKKKYESA